MPLPVDSILVRHGQSLLNRAHYLDRLGDSSLMTSALLEKHSSEIPLTERGIEQAKAAGKWLRENIPGQINFGVTSDFIRARETAGHLGLSGDIWEIDPYLVERDHGELDGLTEAEKQEKYGDDYQRRYIHNFYRSPPNGESRLDISLRWDRAMQSLSQRHHEDRVIIVAHQSIIEAGMMRRLHWTVKQFNEWKQAKDPETEVNNCQIIHFTRRDPVSQNVIPRVRWWRTVCPWNLGVSDPKWRSIEVKLYSSDDLLKMADEYRKAFEN